MILGLGLHRPVGPEVKQALCQVLPRREARALSRSFGDGDGDGDGRVVGLWVLGIVDWLAGLLRDHFAAINCLLYKRLVLMCQGSMFSFQVPYGSVFRTYLMYPPYNQIPVCSCHEFRAS